jgi:hypothetical protein
VKLLQRKRAVDVNPDVGVKLDNDVLVKGQVIIGADGIVVGLVCLNRQRPQYQCIPTRTNAAS